MPPINVPVPDARPRPGAGRERRRSLMAAITSVTVFGLSVGQSAPLLSLLLEQRGIDPTLNGLNASAAFLGVIIGPLLAPHCVRLLGIRNTLLVGFCLDIVLFIAMKLFDGYGAWLVLRMALGLVGSALFTSSEAWINQLAGDAGRGRVLAMYAAALSAGFGLGPLMLSVTGIEGWAPFLANACVTAVAMLPLLGVGDAARSFGRERGGNPLAMFVRAPDILAIIVLFGVYEAALMALLPIWGVHGGLSNRRAAATVSAVYFGSILLQIAIGWLSDAWSRRAALLVCAITGLAGALLLVLVPAANPGVFAILLVWGGVVSGLYPVALSMAGDRFRSTELVTVNAAIIMAYGLGALAGPVLGGIAMDLRDPEGLPALFALLFAGLLIAARRWRAR